MLKIVIDFLTKLSARTPDLLWNIAIIAFSILVGILIKSILVPIIRRYSSTEQGYSIIRSSIKHFRLTFTFFIPLLIFNALLPLMNIEVLTRAAFQRTVEIALTVCFAIIFIRIIRIVEDYLYYRHDYTKVDNLRERRLRTQIQFIRKLLVAIIVIITIAIVLLSFESMRKIGAGLLTGVGVGGIIIGFAAQKSLGNILAGFHM